jgi:predicted heme/steroid binding protein
VLILLLSFSLDFGWKRRRDAGQHEAGKAMKQQMRIRDLGPHVMAPLARSPMLEKLGEAT